MLQKPRGGHCTFHLRVSGKIFKQENPYGRWVGGGWVVLSKILPICSSILQAETCQILGLAENPRWSQVWQKIIMIVSLLQDSKKLTCILRIIRGVFWLYFICWITKKCQINQVININYSRKISVKIRIPGWLHIYNLLLNKILAVYAKYEFI